MEIKKYQANNTPLPELINLLRRKYGKSKNFDYFISDYQKAFDFCVNNENITFTPIASYEGLKINAHIALILDKRLPHGEALFGFLEVPNDIKTFRLMWDNLVKEARVKGASVLKGPVNGSIWHQYRCIKETDGSDFFKSELFSETYYYDFLSSNKPISEIIYHSGYRERFDAILQVGQLAYDKLASAGFVIKEMESGSMENLQNIASISRTVFKNSWGYVELNQKEFFKLYSSEKLAPEITKIYLLYKDGDIIGFCGVLKEDEFTLICKTIALLPEYQGAGLGNALAFKVHLDAKKEGIKKIIYALIRDSNNIKNFPKKDAVVFRKYAAFEFHI
jgi:GNAT superfamily N-acetyltransferase